MGKFTLIKRFLFEIFDIKFYILYSYKDKTVGKPLNVKFSKVYFCEIDITFCKIFKENHDERIYSETELKEEKGIVSIRKQLL